MLQESVCYLQQIGVCELRPKDPGDLVQRAGECPLSLDVTHRGELHVEGAELVPLIFAGHPDEGREVV